MLAKKRPLGLLVVFMILAGAGWWLSHSRLPTTTPTQTSLAIPRIEFRAPQASVSLDSTPTTQQALEVILQEIGYEQSWHFFYLPHELNPVSLEPDVIVLEFLPLSQYQPQLQPHLVERAVDNQGQLLSGTSCQYQLESNTLSCTLFSSYDFAQPQPNQLEPDQYITFATTSTLLLLSKQIGQVRSQELGFTRLHQRLTEVLEAHHYQLVIINQFESSHLLVPRWLSWLEWLKPSPVWAQSNPCGGEPLECKAVQKVCTCPNGQVCKIGQTCTTNGEITDCIDHCVRYCNGPWEISDPFWCENEAWEFNVCRDPYAGTCGERWAGDTEGMYCATRGDCYPVTGPSSSPPPNFTPSPTPPNYTPPPTPTNPPNHVDCQCCDASDWDPGDGLCIERNGFPGLQCCCGTGHCELLSDGSCLDNAAVCTNPSVYYINPISGYVKDQDGNPISGAEVEITTGGTEWNYYESRSFTTDVFGRWTTGMNIYDGSGNWVRCDGWCFNSGDSRVPIRARVKSVPIGFDLTSARTANGILRVKWGGCYYQGDNPANPVVCMNTPPEELSPKPYPGLPVGLYYGDTSNNSCTWVHPSASEYDQDGKTYLTLPAGSKYYACQTCDESYGGCSQQYDFVVDSSYPKVVSVSIDTDSSVCVAESDPQALTINASYEDQTVNPIHTNDIKIFQVNVESQGSAPNTYNHNVWPIRLIVDRSFGPNLLTASSPPNNISGAVSLVAHPSQSEKYYLSDNLEVGDFFRVIGSSNPDEASFITITPTFISATWKLELLENFPSTNPPLSSFYVNGYVQDFTDLQHALQYENYPPPLVVSAGGTNYYFHRRTNLNVTTPNINLRYYESDGNEAPSGSVCENTSSVPATIDISLIPNATLRIKPALGDESSWEAFDISLYREIGICGDFDLELVLDPADGYVCNCAPGFDNFTCHYDNVPSSFADGDPTINFYLLPIDLTHSAWMQAVGSQVIANNGISSSIPFVADYLGGVGGPCHPDQSCWPALVSWSPWLNGTINSPGFVYAGSTISTGNDSASLIHSPSSILEQRNQSQLGHAIDSDLFPTEYNYQYFFNRLGHLAQNFSSSNMPNIPSNSGLSVWHYQPASPGDPLVINETNLWLLSDRQQAVIFVDGDLRLEDSTPDTPDSIISVTNSQNYLAFIVSGDIEIAPSVGYTIPAGLPQAFALPNDVPANVEGIYLADGTLTIESLENPDLADKKFIGAGTFVGWSGVNLERSFSDNNIGQAWHNYNPTETFIYRPDFVVNAPLLMKETVHEWREVAPKKIE